MFEQLLKDVVESSDRGVAAMVMDFEGIALESYTKPGASLDIGTLGAEYSVVLKGIRKASEMLEAGSPTEVTVTAGNIVCVLRLLTDDYFLVIALEPQGNLGKARFQARVRTPDLVKELA